MKDQNEIKIPKAPAQWNNSEATAWESGYETGFARARDLLTARALVHQYLYHGSPLANSLTINQHNDAMAIGDGYGKMTVDQLKANGLTWDWSHLRDSSDDAILAVAAFLKSI